MKGQYLLHIRVAQKRTITIGKLGSFTFPEGDYVYVGSALNGIEQRVARHRKKGKKLRWHIDYLLEHADIIRVEMIESSCKENECLLAQQAEGDIVVRGFGSSDCRCMGHLFRKP